jgi:hypothetical protein
MIFSFKWSSLFFISFLSSTLCFSQAKEEPKLTKRIDVGLEGMIGISFNSNTIGINVGGPSLKFRYNKNVKVGVGAFPSLVIQDSKAFPRLGVSPILEYKKWLFIVPYYGYDSYNKTIWTYGLGYKFN